MDNRASRRDKFLSISPDDLMFMVRRWLFEIKCTPLSYVEKALVSIAERGKKEGKWLLEKLGDLKKLSDTKRLERHAQIVEIMKKEESLWGWYYYGRAIRDFDLNDAVNSLRKSAEAGFAPAMSIFSEDNLWIKRSAELNDPDGLLLLSLYDPNEFELLKNAANRGSSQSCYRLISFFRDRLSPVESV